MQDGEAKTERQRQRPLDGVRIVDFSWVRAGPWATRWLGALGAEIIKIEWPETERGRLPSSTTPQGMEVNLNTSGNFNDTNVNKKSMTLNVRSEKGLAIVKKLIAVSDVVIENFSSRVLTKWGLGYDELKKIKPDIVYVSMSGYGHTGRNHSYTTFGPVAQAASGLTHLSGLPGEPPAGWGWSYMDDTGGLYGVMCVLTGIYHRNKTGQGQHIDQAQMVSSVPLNGAALLDLTVNGRGSKREGFPPGNRAHWPGTQMLDNYRGPMVAPHNAYRTDPGGYNDWAVIVCQSDEEWQRLVKVMGDPDWATAERFSTNAGRLENQEALDQAIESWTRTLGKYELMALCQNGGVRAMPVQSAEDRVENDPQLKHRGMYLPLPHAALGTFKVQNAPFKMSRTPAYNHCASPLIGEHTAEICEGLLGLSHADVREGFADGTFWPTTRKMFPYMEEMAK
ncbi:MAG: CaiB/BaiF CoA transferase family protein [Hyphomicrobiaceae bacterium]